MLDGGTLTRTSAAGSDAAHIAIAFDNDGTVDVGAGTLSLDSTFTNYDTVTDVLSGGAYKVRNGSTLRFFGADVKNNAAEITLEDAGSRFWDGSQDGLRSLQTDDATGKLALRDGRDFTRTGGFTNNGTIDLDDSVTFTTTGAYTQSATGTLATDIRAPWPGPATAGSAPAASRASTAPSTSTSARMRRRPATSSTSSSAARAPAPSPT